MKANSKWKHAPGKGALMLGFGALAATGAGQAMAGCSFYNPAMLHPPNASRLSTRAQVSPRPSTVPVPGNSFQSATKRACRTAASRDCGAYRSSPTVSLPTPYPRA